MNNCDCLDTIEAKRAMLKREHFLIADQDYFDFISPESEGYGDAALTRLFYQCKGCGRIYIEDVKGELLVFSPDFNFKAEEE